MNFPSKNGDFPYIAMENGPFRDFIVSFSSKNGDVPWLCKRLEGIIGREAP